MKSSVSILTFDLGGSHVSAGLCSLATLEILHLASAPLAGIATFESFIELLYSLGRQVETSTEKAGGAALAVPGPFDCVAGVSLMKHKLDPLYGREMRGAIAARFGFEPRRIRFLNDASAFLLGEVGAGSARGAVRAAGLTLGTGIGCSFAINGHPVTEGPGVPPGGEIWNFPYRGATVEDLISTRALKRAYADATGKDIEVKAIAEAAATEPAAMQVFESFGTDLGQVLHDVIAPFHPDIVVIGGGISRSSHLFLPAAEKQIHADAIRIVTSTLLDRAPLVGAAAFWRDELAGSAAQPAHTAYDAQHAGHTT